MAGLGLSPCWVLQASGADLRARIIRKILFSFVFSWPGRPCVPVGSFTHQRLACRPAGPNNSEDFFFVCRFVAGLGLSACWVLHAWGANRRFRLIRKILFLFVVSCPGFFTLGVQTGRPNNSEDFIFVCRFVAGLGLCLCWVLHALGADRRARIIRKILFLFVVSWLGVASAPVRFFKLGVQTDSPE